MRTLAPDASAARAGEELGNPRRWTALGRTETAAWGLCQGSGSSPYQAAVDLAGPAYKCSCPSRKIPCKHALGLLFLLADAKVIASEAPEWVATWLASRAARATAAATAEPRPEADPAARAKRVESRERKVAGGLEELDRWLGDLVRRGLDAAHAEGYGFWDAMGARLVDAQAAGLGRQARALGSAASAGDGWPNLLLEGAARLHLVCAAYQRGDALPGDLVSDVRSIVGWTTREEDLADDGAVEDRWLVIGRRIDDGGQVVTARTYLLGEASGRMALHLAFGVTAAPPTVLAVPGQAFRATAAFYPSATPLRVAVRPVLVPDREATSLPGAATIAEMLDAHARRLAANPFADRWPVVLGPVVPVLRETRLLVRDEAGRSLRVEPAGAAEPLLALSGGHPVTLCAEWDGSVLWPLSVLAGARLVPVEVPDAAALPLDGDEDWATLVSAALLGTERLGAAVPVRDPVRQLVDGADRERSLLSAAGVTATRLRAGRRAIDDAGPLPDPAPHDPRPPLAGAAARLLAIAAGEPVLLPELFALLRASGWRIPDESLPALLRRAAGDDGLRAAVADLGGPRATWLAAQLPALRAGAAAPAPAALDRWEDAWDDTRGARARAALAAELRAADAAAAREAIARWLPGVPGDERAGVVAALGVALGPDDEPVLATALEDRRQDVRRAAADLLARLDGSAFARSIEALARPLLATGGRFRPSLTVALPPAEPGTGPDIAALAGKAPQGYGERAWLLRHLLGLVRPDRWATWLATDAGDLVDRALRCDEARPVLDGWVVATERFADPTWVASLLGRPKVAETVELPRARLLLALEPAVRDGVVEVVARSLDPAALAAVCEAATAPWPAALADAALDAIRKAGGTDYPDTAYYQLVRAAAAGLPVRRGDDLVALASRDGRTRPSLEESVDLVRLRSRIHQAFADLPRPAIEEPR